VLLKVQNYWEAYLRTAFYLILIDKMNETIGQCFFSEVYCNSRLEIKIGIPEQTINDVLF
jgi:hypothetical protein